MKRYIYESFWRRWTVLIVLLGLSTTGFAQIELVEDINPYVHFDNEYGAMAEVNGTLFFAAEQSLWKSDGTAPGTIKIKSFASIGAMVRLNGILLFSADDGIAGIELWKSDGTERGTVLVKDINNGEDDSSPSAFTIVGNTLFFVATTGPTGAEVWKTNGTKQGTSLVGDVRPGPESSNPSELVAYNGKLVFVATDGISGEELRVVSPGSKSEVNVIDILPGSDGSNPAYLTVMSSSLFFNANTPEYGIELWKTDATDGGTVMVRDISPGPQSSNASLMIDVAGTLFFIADDGVNGSEYWKSDGTTTGTSLAFEILPGVDGSFGDYPYEEDYGLVWFAQAAANGKLYFSYANLLYESDGTTAVSLGRITDGYYYYSPRPYTARGTIYVLAMDESNCCNYGHRWSLMRVENSTLVTVTTLPRSENINLQLLDTSLGIFFPFADDQRNFKLWISDGTAEGTYTIHDARGYTLSSSPRGMVVVEDYIVFYADDHIEHVITNLWRSDGTPEGTYRISDGPVEPPDFYSKEELTRSEKSAWMDRISATHRVRADSGNIHLLEFYKGAMYFSVTDPVKSYAELWRTDGTNKGTVRIKVLSKEYGGGARDGAVFNGILYFAGTPSNIWRTDGTAKGTFEVGYTGTGAIVNTEEFVATTTTLFFRAYHPGVGFELFKLDAQNALLAGTVIKSTQVPIAEGVISLSCYPNPFTHSFNFSLQSTQTQPMSMSVRSIAGRTILEMNDLSTNHVYSIGKELRIGLYLLHVRLGDRVFMQRVIKTE